MRQLKFGGIKRLAAPLAELMLPVVPTEWFGRPVIPVPSHRASVARRGYSPVRLVAQELAARIGSVERPLLCKSRGREQKSLSYAGRLAAVDGRFWLSTARPPLSALIVDDVFTTGATLSECARVLKSAGCLSVGCVTFSMEA